LKVIPFGNGGRRRIIARARADHVDRAWKWQRPGRVA
jgi:hypothetical protein